MKTYNNNSNKLIKFINEHKDYLIGMEYERINSGGGLGTNIDEEIGAKPIITKYSFQLNHLVLYYKYSNNSEYIHSIPLDHKDFRWIIKDGYLIICTEQTNNINIKKILRRKRLESL